MPNRYLIDELVFLASVILASGAILHRAKAYGGLRDCIRKFLADGAEGKPILLLILIVPIVLLGTLTVSVLFRLNPPNTVSILIWVLFSQNVVLGLYFFNGSLVKGIRFGVQQGVNLWNRLGIYRV